MTTQSARPDVTSFEIHMDAWTQPFWDATAAGKLLLPRCVNCGHFRWPPGPFCPKCHAQNLEWVPSGEARVYSFTIVPSPTGSAQEARPLIAPALMEFPDAGGIRFLAAIIDTPLDAIRIGAKADLAWSKAANGMIPVFKIAKA